MEEHRIAEVYATADGLKKGKRGSGYLISPGLVLTAHHVIEPAENQGECKVRFFDEEKQQTSWQQSRVVWANKDLDVALLGRLESNGPFLDGISPVEIGVPAGQRLVRVDAVGFGEALTQEENRTDTLPISGWCHPKDSIKSNRLHIKNAWIAPKDPKDWEGESGAVVFAGDVLVGVIVETPENFDTDVLRAVSARALVSDAEFVKTCNADGIVTELQPVNTTDVESLPDIGWQELQKRYTEEVVQNLCLFEFAGLSIEGASKGGILNARDAYGGIEFVDETYPPRRFDIHGLLNLQAILLISGPGSGKSGALKLLLNDVATTSKLMPVFLPLSRLAAVDDISVNTIIDVISEQAVSKLGLPEATSQFFWRMLTRGKCCIAFDALDEIYTREQRQKTVYAIRKLLDKVPGNHFVLTSRYDEFLDVLIPDSKGEEDEKLPFKKLTIADFTMKQIRDYLHVWFGDEGNIYDRITSRPELMQMEPGPLLLNLMGLLARDQDLPLDTFELHDAFIKTALSAWEKLKGKDSSAPPLAICRNALEQLAWLSQNQQQLLENTAINAIVDVAQNQDPVELLDWLSRRSGILRKDKQYGKRRARTFYQFWHQQMQEFLAGCELARRLKTDFNETWESIVRNILHDNWWNEVLHFAVLSLQQTTDLHNNLFRNVLATPPSENALGNEVIRAAQLIRDCDPEFVDEDISNQVTKLLVDIIDTQNIWGFITEAVDAIYALAELGFDTAFNIIENIATDYVAAKEFLSKFYDTDHRYVSAVLMLCRKHVPSAQSALAQALTKTTNIDDRLLLAQCHYELGQPQQAREMLLQDFTVRLTVKESEDKAFYRLLAELANRGFEEDSYMLARKYISEESVNPNAKLECGLWLYGKQEVTRDNLYQIAIEALPRLPRNDRFSGQDAMEEILLFAHEDLETVADAYKLVCNAMLNPAYAYGWTYNFRDLDSELGVATREGEKAIIRETSDDSRRVGLINMIADDKNVQRAHSTLLNLLNEKSVLLSYGARYTIMNCLIEQGRGLDAIDVLKRLLEENKLGTEAMQEVRKLIDKYTPKINQPNPELVTT